MKELFELLGAPSRGRFLLALALSAIAGAAGVVLLGLSGWFLTASALAGMSGAGLVFNHLYPSAGVRGAAFTRVLARYAEQLVGHDATLRLSAQLRPQLFEKGALAGRGFTPMPASTLAALIDDVEAVEGGFLRVLSPLAAVLASVLVALGFTMAASLWLGLVTLLALLLAGWLLPRRAARAAHEAATAFAATSDDRRSEVANLVENAVELDVYGALPRLSTSLEKDLSLYQETEDTLGQPFRRLGAINAALGGSLAFLLLSQAGGGTAGLAIAAGGALSLLSAFDALGTMAKVLDAAPRALASANRLKQKLTEPDAVPAPAPCKATELTSIFPIEAAALRFAAATGAPAIGPLDFSIRPGSVTLIEGPSGCGKTTLLEALMRLQPVDEGSLRYGGVDIRDCRTPAVLSYLAISPQFPAVLPGKLRDQFRLADPDITDDKIETALEIACLGRVIRARGEGLDLSLTEKMEELSGGEMRRLGLARALAAGPAVLLLDEPFSGLEQVLARQIADNLTHWAKEENRALIIASHEDLKIDWSPLSLQEIRLGAEAMVLQTERTGELV